MFYLTFIKNFSLLLIFAKKLNHSVNIPQIKFYMYRFGITQFLDIKIILFFFENWTKGNILYAKDLFDVNETSKVLTTSQIVF